MENLTDYNEKGNAYYTGCYKKNCNGIGEDCNDCTFIDITVCEKLRAYENTGLSPEQIVEMDRLYKAKCEEVAELRKMISLLS